MGSISQWGYFFRLPSPHPPRSVSLNFFYFVHPPKSYQDRWRRQEYHCPTHSESLATELAALFGTAERCDVGNMS